jgi:uncharacterized repeat protein (TIGR04138 family)
MADIAQQVHDLALRMAKYRPQAYFFVFEALEHTVQNIVQEQRHVTGQELLEGIRQLAIQQFGPMALTVFRLWGVHHTEDFGEIVFQLVESGLMGKTDEDSRADFANGYLFEDAFSLDKTLESEK